MAVVHPILTKMGIVPVKLTPMKAIREKCMECSNWQFKEVRLCPAVDCALWPFRFGRSPQQGDLDDPQKNPS